MILLYNKSIDVSGLVGISCSYSNRPKSTVESKCAKVVFASKVGVMSVHSESCVLDATAPEEADAACTEAFAVVSGVIRDGGTLTKEQLKWAARHAGLPEGSDTEAVAGWLRRRQR
jgi:hypothetical protein